jgi:hypothetical protein
LNKGFILAAHHFSKKLKWHQASET